MTYGEKRNFGWRILNKDGVPAEYQGSRDEPKHLGDGRCAQKVLVKPIADLGLGDKFFTHPTNRDPHTLLHRWVPIEVPDTEKKHKEGVVITEADIAIKGRADFWVYVPTNEYRRDLVPCRITVNDMQRGDILEVGGQERSVEGAVIYDDRYVEVHFSDGYPFMFPYGQEIVVKR